MRYLLDTCTLLWWFDRAGLSPRAQQEIVAPENDIYVSVASAWEIAIKYSMGRLDSRYEPETLIAAVLEETPTKGLEAKFPHVLAIGALPFHHKDPFDRLLIAQAQVEKLTIVTPDPLFQPYGVALLW